MHLEEKTLNVEHIFEGKVVKLQRDTVLLENDETATREVITHPGGVCIVAVTENNEVMMVRQFRYPQRKVLLEVPAGKLEWEEDPFEAAKRELKEEVGTIASEYTELGQFMPTPAYDSEIIYMYMAKGLTFSEQKLDADEFLDVEKMPLEKAVQMVINGEIKDGKTQAALLKTYYLLKNN